MAEENKAEGEQQAAAEEADAVKKKGEAPAPSGPNQKFVFIVLILNSVVLIAVAALVALSYMKQSNQVSLADVATSKDGAEAHGGGEHGADPHGGGGEKKKEVEAGSNFLKESFTVNLADSRGAHFAKVDVDIEVEDESVKQAVTAILPKIRDFIVVVLSSKTYEQVSSSDGRDFLREEIRNKINGYLPRGQIKDVYFTQFIVQ